MYSYPEGTEEIPVQSSSVVEEESYSSIYEEYPEEFDSNSSRRPPKSPPPRYPSSSSSIALSSAHASLVSSAPVSSQKSEFSIPQIPTIIRAPSSSSISSARSSHSSQSSEDDQVGSIFDRENFWYTEPIFPEGSVKTLHTFSRDPDVILFNVILSVITAFAFAVFTPILQTMFLRGPKSFHIFIRRLPLSLAAFLVLVGLGELLFPTAFAQDAVQTVASPGTILSFYGLLFFFVAGVTNAICNNMVAADAATLEGIFLPADKTSAPWKRNKMTIIIFFLLFAVIGAHINAQFSIIPTRQIGMLLISFVTILIMAYSKDGIRYFLAAGRGWDRWLEANVIGILFAILSIWVTRKLSLSPGYLFGIPAGIFVASKTYHEKEGPFEWSGLLTMQVFAFIAWFLIPFATGMQVVDDFLKILFVILIEATFFESLPLPYLAGSSLMKWKKWIWALQCGVATFLVLHLLWNPASSLPTLTSSPPGFTYVLILCGYVLFVFTTYLYCKMKRS